MDKINNINFKGSFLINYKNVPVGTRKNLETVIGKNGKVVFDNFANKKESVMYVLRNSKDKAVADFVEQNKLDFKYYPEINTQFRFDSDDESTLVNYIKNNKPKIISNLNDLLPLIFGSSICPGEAFVSTA